MHDVWRCVGRGVGLGLLGVALGMGWAAWAEAKNCSVPAGNCACGDTITVGGTFPSAQPYHCPKVNQAFKVAAGVTVNCNGSWFTSDHTVDNSAAIRLLGGKIVSCWAWDGWEIGVKLDGNGSQMWYGGVGGNISQEGIHASNGTSGHVIYGVDVRVPMEAMYFQGSRNTHVEASVFVGSPATYANNGASGNLVKSCDLSGGSNRSIFSAAGPNNHWESNNYHNGVIRSVGGSTYPNYIGPSPNATIQNTDGALYVY